MVTAALATLLLHCGAQILHRAVVTWMVTAAFATLLPHFGAQTLHRAGVAWMATAAFATLLLHFGAQIQHAQVSPSGDGGWAINTVSRCCGSPAARSDRRQC